MPGLINEEIQVEFEPEGTDGTVPATEAGTSSEAEVKNETSPSTGQPETSGEPSLRWSAPAAFTWRAEKYRISAILRRWHEHKGVARPAAYPGARGLSGSGRGRAAGAPGGGADSPGRDYFRVRTEDGSLFDIFREHSGKAKEGPSRWVLHKQLA
ncbi:MAG: hypothetical protein HYY08_01705 [Firmicutes bacterium]|nr:hypothetical protein [Bacillota bacterium]